MAHTHGGPIYSYGSAGENISGNKEARTRSGLIISLIGLLAIALFQAAVAAISDSTALLADTIYNFGNLLTSILLWAAFSLSRRRPTKRFTFGFRRSENLAGSMIVLVIFFSAVLAGYESIGGLFAGSSPSHLGAAAIAAAAGFIGNEAAAVCRIRAGKRIGSAVLIADGRRVRINGWTSLAVLAGILATWLGYPVIDPIIGLIIAFMILVTVKNAARTVFTQWLNGIDPKYIETIEKTAARVDGVRHVRDVKARRQLGHRIVAELSITLPSDSSVREGHAIVRQIIHRLRHEIEHLSAVQIHVEPAEEQGVSFHTHK
ncbi:cation diffusion facilitator family transporter [Sporolactobacillus sp. KGMB 08714]|uniref:cation diffusion facilitator family transporter n=1 Tax=Sporolactobacillus sp. KGMB 08714 TaxID=3064704 RepID=UPI002FBE08B8